LECAATLVNRVGGSPVGKAQTVSASKPKKSKNVEFEIGQYLLNRLGVLSLVVGIAFFIAYSFKYIGIIPKLAIGFGIAGLLLFLGKWIESKSQEMKWYGLSLIGGAWGLFYFTAFAMHHVKAVQIIQNPNIALILLAFVTSLMTVDLMRYKSQVITTLVYVLAFVTAGIGKVSYFSLFYSAILTFSLVFVIHRMKWNRLMLFAVAASYISHIVWLGPEILVAAVLTPNVSLEMSRFLLSAGFLSIYWILFTVAPFLILEEKTEDRHTQTIATILNAFFFGLCIFQEVSRINPEWRFYLALAIGLFSVGAACYAKYISKRENLVITHVTLAISFITVSFPLKFMDRWVDIAWLVEIPVLIFLGLYFERTLYRVVAWVLGFIMTLKAFALFNQNIASHEALVGFGSYLTERSLITAVAVTMFYITSAVYLYYQEKLKSLDWEPNIGRGFFVIATILLAALSSMDIHDNFISIVWAASAFAFFVTGFLLKDKWFRYTALGLIGLIVARVLIYDARNLPTLYRIVLFVGLGLALLLTSFVYGKVAAFQKREIKNEA
jgi:uncharacterized membrane protein